MKLSLSAPSFVCMTCRQQAARTLSRRTFTTTRCRRAEDDRQPVTTQQTQNTSSSNPTSSEANDLTRHLPQTPTQSADAPTPRATGAASFSSLPSGQSAQTHKSQPNTTQRDRPGKSYVSKPIKSDILQLLEGQFDGYQPSADTNSSSPRPTGPHRLYIYAHKHNMHLTLTQAPRLAIDTVSSDITRANASAKDRAKEVDVLMSMSTGKIGFRKAARGTFDAAFQLGAYFLRQMKERGMLKDLKQLEVVMRGFGPGREAMQKILLGTEGRLIRDRVTTVMDATRLKIGGCRSPKPRRL